MQPISSFFKKIFAAVLALVMLLLPAQPAGDVQVMLPEITTDTETVAVTMTNHGDDVIGYGLDAFTVEKRTAFGWTPLQKTGNYVVAAVMMSLAPGETGTLHVNFPLVYGKTPDAGLYRFRFHYFVDTEKRIASVTFAVQPA